MIDYRWIALVVCCGMVSACAPSDKRDQSVQVGKSQASPLNLMQQASCDKKPSFGQYPWRAKIDSNVLCAVAKAREEHWSFSQAAARMGMQSNANGVALDIVMNRLDGRVQDKLNIAGVSITFLSETYKRVSIVIQDANLLDQLAAIPEVRSIKAEYGGRTR